MKPLSRINTWVPSRTKSRIAAVARRTGLKNSDVIRIGLGLALDQFEAGYIRLGGHTSTPKGRPARRTPRAKPARPGQTSTPDKSQ